MRATSIRCRTFEKNERIHYSDLKDRYLQRRDCTRQWVAQLSTQNSRKKLTATEVRLLAKKLYSKVGLILSLLHFATSRVR